MKIAARSIVFVDSRYSQGGVSICFASRKNCAKCVARVAHGIAHTDEPVQTQIKLVAKYAF